MAPRGPVGGSRTSSQCRPTSRDGAVSAQLLRQACRTRRRPVQADSRKYGLALSTPSQSIGSPPSSRTATGLRSASGRLECQSKSRCRRSSVPQPGDAGLAQQRAGTSENAAVDANRRFALLSPNDSPMFRMTALCCGSAGSHEQPTSTAETNWHYFRRLASWRAHHPRSSTRCHASRCRPINCRPPVCKVTRLGLSAELAPQDPVGRFPLGMLDVT